MTRLHIVREGSFHPESLRADPLTHARTLETTLYKIIAPTEVATTELRQAIQTGDLADLIPGLRRLVAIGEIAKRLADSVERGGAA